jgi:ribosomal protein S18 acetylase RimI-like enzyme
MSMLDRLHRSLLAELAVDREHVPLEGFDAYVDHLRTPKYYSMAMAHPEAGSAHLPALRAAFAARGRNARTEFFEALHPGLEAELLADGWILSERMPVMTCGSRDFVVPPPADGVTVELVSGESPDDLVLGFLRAQRVAFRDDTPITDEELVRWRSRAGAGYFAAGLLDGEIVGTAFCTPFVDGVTEVGGVATPPPYRRRGIAAAVTAAALDAAFAAGAELAWLTAAADESRRIYERMGFTEVGTLLAYDAADRGSPTP